MGLVHSGLVGKSSVLEEHLGLADLVVKHDAVERTVHAIVDVVHVRGVPALLRRQDLAEVARNGSASNDLGRERESRAHIVTAGLGNDTNLGAEQRVDGRTQDGGHLLECDPFSHMSRWESTSNVQKVERKAIVLGLVKHTAGTDHCLTKGIGIEAATADVETNSNHVQVQLPGRSQQESSGVQRCAKLESELAERLRIISQDAEHQLSIGVEALDLVQFLRVVKGHHMNIVGAGILDKRVLLARVGVNDAAGVDAHFKHRLDLVLGSTVETGAERGQKAHHHGIGVALHG